VNLCVTNRVRDVMCVPVSISYDKVIEGASYVNELLGMRVCVCVCVCVYVCVRFMFNFN